LPPIRFHLGIAADTITGLKNPIVDENRGSYYLGATAPDIRFFINARREETHFLPLDSEEGMSGVESMFETYPELIEDTGLTPETRAFVAGYLSHLATDEAWLFGIYRPFFSRSSLMGGKPIANLMDRLLQFELDRRERLDRQRMSEIRAELNDSTYGITVSFIDQLSLKKWREFVLSISGSEANWNDFRYFAERYLSWMKQIAIEERDAFFASLDDRLDNVLDMVSEERIRDFREQAVVDSIRVSREYLS